MSAVWNRVEYCAYCGILELLTLFGLRMYRLLLFLAFCATVSTTLEDGPAYNVKFLQSPIPPIYRPTAQLMHSGSKRWMCHVGNALAKNDETRDKPTDSVFRSQVWH